MPPDPQPAPAPSGVSLKIELLGFLVAIPWVLEIADFLIPGQWLDSWGIRPRTLSGLIGIPLAPWLHGGFHHLIANTLPLLVLAWLVMLYSVRTFLAVTVGVILLGGLGVWLFGASSSIHIGASGLVYGYFGFLLLRAWFERSIGSCLIAALVVVLYSGLIWGVLPTQPHVSWEGHLFGFLGGIASARFVPHDKAQ